jgi:hypothetical protein
MGTKVVVAKREKEFFSEPPLTMKWGALRNREFFLEAL